MNKNDNGFLIARYNAWVGALSRIKQDEQKWIGVLLLIHGAILAFIISIESEKFCLSCGHRCIYGLSAALLILLILSIIWAEQALNLRLQYYRTKWEILKIHHEFGDPKDCDKWSKDFKTWRKQVTRPNESKIAEFWVAGSLFFVSGFILIYKFSCICNLKICFAWYILFFGCSYFLTFLYYKIRDKQKLKKFYNEGRFNNEREKENFNKRCLELMK